MRTVTTQRKGLRLTQALFSRAFAWFWLGQTFSTLGDGAFTMALAVAVYQLTGSSLIMGFFLMAKMIPELLFTLFGGVAADRLPRRLLLVCADSGRALTVLAIAALAWLHLLQVWHLFVLAVLFGLCHSIFNPAYRANDPANLLWVHATLADSALRVYREMVEELSPADAATYYREMMLVAEVFGLPVSDQPASLAGFRAYFDEMVATLRVSDEGRRLGNDVLYPSLPAGLRVPLAPALALNRLVAVGTTPEPLREQFGFAWDQRREQQLARVQSTAAHAFRLAPRPLRTTPGWLNGRLLLWQAGRRVGAGVGAGASAA